MASEMTIAHLSDPHIAFALPRMRDLIGKRALTMLSWKRRRGALHRRDLADMLCADCLAARPDFIAVTGDLVHFTLECEFAGARGWLEGLGPADRVAVVPGNHEALVAGMEATMERHWQGYIDGDGEKAAGSPVFPWSRRFPAFEVEIIGVSSAVVTLPLLASGRVGARQMAALEALLSRPTPGWCRVVLIHHPPSDIASARKALTNRREFADVLLRNGVQLVLHGHLHRDVQSRIGTGAGAIPVLGVPSLTVPPGGGRHAAAWRSITLSRGEAGMWRAATRLRAAAGDGTVREMPQAVLDLPGSTHR